MNNNKAGLSFYDHQLVDILLATANVYVKEPATGTFDPLGPLNIEKQQTVKEQVVKLVRKGRDSDVSFEAFPYYLAKSTKSELLMATFMHLEGAKNAKYVPGKPSATSSRILLNGPLGSEIYQENLVKALAKHYDANYRV
jgi:hypothetical protein